MLNFDKSITVFSFNGKRYDRIFFEGVSIFGAEGIAVTDSGFKQNAEYKIRIPAEDVLDIKCGDRVIFGNAEQFQPEVAYTIMEIKDNRRGNIKHYLLNVK